MFIHELFEKELPRQPVTMSSTPTKVVRWIKENCSEYMKNARAAEALIFRGVSSKAAVAQIGDTSHFKRVSANADNFYTMFLSSSPKWSDYPSREHAFVCASSSDIAESYGTVYLVFPADDARIGVCPAQDLWFSFEKLGSLGMASLNSLNLFIRHIHKSGKNLPDNPEDLRKFLRGIRKKDLEPYIDIWSNFGTECEAIASVIGDRNFEELLEECLDPKANGFWHTTAAKYELARIGKGNEVWIEGKAAFIRLDDVKSTPAIVKMFDEQLKFSLD